MARMPGEAAQVRDAQVRDAQARMPGKAAQVRVAQARMPGGGCTGEGRTGKDARGRSTSRNTNADSGRERVDHAMTIHSLTWKRTVFRELEEELAKQGFLLTPVPSHT